MRNSPATLGAEPTLTPQQQQFLQLYLGHARGNAVEACRLMGVSADETVLRRLASRFLRTPAVQFHLDKWASRHMAPTEILALFASHARGDMADYWDVPEDPAIPPTLNLRKAVELGVTSRIKKIKVNQKDGSVEIELYDSQAAGRELAKLQGMHRQDSNVHHTIEHVTRSLPAELRDQLMIALGQMVAGELGPGDPPIDAEATVYVGDDALALPYETENAATENARESGNFPDDESESA